MGFEDLLKTALSLKLNANRPRLTLPSMSTNNVGIPLGDNLGQPGVFNPYLQSPLPVNGAYDFMPSNEDTLNRYNNFQQQAREMGLINDDGLNQINQLIADTDKKIAEAPNKIDLKTSLLSALMGFGGGFTGNQVLASQGANLLESKRQEIANNKTILEERSNKLKTAKAELAIADQNRVKNVLDSLFSASTNFSYSASLNNMNNEAKKVLLQAENYYNNQIRDRVDVNDAANRSLQERVQTQDGFEKAYTTFIDLGLENALDIAASVSFPNENGKIVVSPEYSKQVSEAVKRKEAQKQQLIDIQMGKYVKANQSTLEGLRPNTDVAKVSGNINQYGIRDDIKKNIERNGGTLSTNNERVDSLIDKIANEVGGSAYIAKAIVLQESAGSGYGKATSNTGVRGLFQFTTDTGKQFGLITNEDFTNDEKQTRAFFGYWKYLEKTYDGYLPAMLAEYNGGPIRAKQIQEAGGNVNAIRTDNPKKDKETQDYVTRIMGTINTVEGDAVATPEYRAKVAKEQELELKRVDEALEKLGKEINDVLLTDKVKKQRKDPATNQPVMDPITKEAIFDPMNEDEKKSLILRTIIKPSIIKYRLDPSDPRIKAFFDSYLQQTPEANSNQVIDQAIKNNFGDRELTPADFGKLAQQLSSNKQISEDERIALGIQLMERAKPVFQKNSAEFKGTTAQDILTGIFMTAVSGNVPNYDVPALSALDKKAKVANDVNVKNTSTASKVDSTVRKYISMGYTEDKAIDYAINDLKIYGNETEKNIMLSLLMERKNKKTQQTSKSTVKAIMSQNGK